VYALDARTVLRRYRGRDVPAGEVNVMRYVRAHGYPAPEVVSVDRADLVLERATGSTMRVDLARRPWMLIGHARLLADLHRRLHRIAAPDWLPAIGPGGTVIHLDLHPENVLLHGKGALVIDWANARAEGTGRTTWRRRW
jgi:tRNA A-37 threonylcarbamoyl transferase component Bud32